MKKSLIFLSLALMVSISAQTANAQDSDQSVDECLAARGLLCGAVDSSEYQEAVEQCIAEIELREKEIDRSILQIQIQQMCHEKEQEIMREEWFRKPFR